MPHELEFRGQVEAVRFGLSHMERQPLGDLDTGSLESFHFVGVVRQKPNSAVPRRLENRCGTSEATLNRLVSQGEIRLQRKPVRVESWIAGRCRRWRPYTL